MLPLRRPEARDVAILLAIAAMWGTSFPAIKIAVAEIGPASLAAYRIAIGAAAVLAFLAGRGLRLPRSRRAWLVSAAVGLLSTAAPFTLISWGEQSIDSATAAILLSAMPAMSLVLAHFATRDDRMSPLKLLGIALGFAGVLVLIGADALAGLESAVWGSLAVLGAATCYAVSGIATRYLPESRPDEATGAALLTGLGFSLLIAFATEEPLATLAGAEGISLEAWIAVAYLGLVSTGVATVLRFRLILSVGSTFMSLVNYLVPVFGVFSGAVLLTERIGPETWAALALILVGVWVSRLRPERLRARFSRRSDSDSRPVG